jgi:hypothetical protein
MNYDPTDPIAGTAGAIAEWRRERRALPPGDRAADHAALGAAAIGFAVYFLVMFGTRLERSWLIGLLGLAGLGLVGLLFGLSGIRRQPPVNTRAVAGLILLGIGIFVIVKWYPWIWYNAFWRGFCIPMICNTCVRVCILMYPRQGDPFKIVQQNQLAKNPPIVAARKGFRWF